MAEVLADRVRHLTASLETLVSAMEKTGHDAPMGDALREVDTALKQARTELDAARAERLQSCIGLPLDQATQSLSRAQQLEDRLESSVAELAELKCRMVADLAAFLAVRRSVTGKEPGERLGRIEPEFNRAMHAHSA